MRSTVADILRSFDERKKLETSVAMRDKATARLPVMMRSGRHHDIPSYDRKRGSCGGTTRLPLDTQYVPHFGTRQRLRVFRTTWKHFERVCSWDPIARVARERLLDHYADNPAAELACLALAHGAWCAVAPHDGRWADAVNQFLNQLEEAERK